MVADVSPAPPDCGSTMTVSDVQSVLAAARWTDEAFYLKEFIHKFGLPQVGKVVKGQYLNLGVSTLSSPSLNSNILLASAGRRTRVIAQCVKFKDGKKVIPVGPKLAIPETYEGFFEILSEDGRSVRCMETVGEVARRFPDSVLVRENIKAFVSKSDDIETIQDKSRLICAGEVLILVGEVLGVKGKQQIRFLRCFDQAGENVYLPYDQKGKFSAIAKEENISGVHNIKNLQKKRLPLMVRLAAGSSPVGLKSSQLFLPELRLLSRVEEDALVALPLNKEGAALSLPPAAVLKLQPAANSEAVTSMKEVARLVERALNQMAELADRILVHDITGGRDVKQEDKSQKPRKVSSLPQQDIPRTGALYGFVGNKPSESSRPDDYDEIDQIYDYVRGFAPLPKSAKGWQYIAEKGAEDKKETVYTKLGGVGQQDAENRPPEPPPIETIPGRKSSSHSPMEMTPPVTPPFSPPWGSPTHQPGNPPQHPAPAPILAPLGPNGQMIGIVPPPHLVLDRPLSADHNNIYEKSGESKKRQRPKTADPKKVQQEESETKEATQSRYVKSSNKQNSSKHKFFRSRTRGQEKEVGPPPMGSLSASAFYRSPDPRPASQPSFFSLRYKSLTNLAHQEYDTLDSSNSGGKTSFDSAGSRNVPEKRSRKLVRPRSLTNLVWDFRSGGGTLMQRSSSKPSILIGEAGPVSGLGSRGRHASHALAAAARKTGGNNKMATLYL